MILKEELVAIISGVIISILFISVIMSFLLKLLWAWVVPELFPGAVAQGLIVDVLSWSMAFKLVIFIMVLSMFFNRKYTFLSSRNSDT